MIQNATLVFLGKNPERILKRYVKMRKRLGKWHQLRKSEEIQ
jgi:hypothetical protein